MRTRILSALVALLIFVPILLYGSWPYTLLVFLLSIQGMKEFLHAYKKDLPEFIQFISYLSMTLFVLSYSLTQEANFSIDFRVFAGMLLLYFIPVIIYQNEEEYNIVDAFSLCGAVFLLATGFLLLISIRNMNLAYIIYLFLITIMTDTYALFTGVLVGKHKCVPKISPNKTWEGVLGGTFMGTFVGAAFFKTVVVTEAPLFFIILMTLFLSLIGQFGDLVFSAIKRKYEIKDFSNFMPGHGGILDRFDSIFFCLLAFTFFLSII